MVEENRTVYVFVDKDGVVDGYSLTKEDGAFEVLNPPTGFEEVFDLYRYYDGELYFDKEIKIESFREGKLLELENTALKEIDKGFIWENKGRKLLFPYGIDNRIEIQSMKELFANGIILKATLTFFDEDKEPVRVSIDKTSFNEISLLGFLHRDKVSSYYRDFLSRKVKNAETTEQIINIEWDYDGYSTDG